jgi:hypothetical protein
LRLRHQRGETHVEAATTDIAPDEQKRRREAIASADGTIERCKKALADAEREQQDAQRAAQEARDAAQRVAELPEDASDPAEVERAREAVRHAERRLQAFDAYEKARRLHEQVRQQEQVIAVLAPDGLRRRKLAEAAEAFARDHVTALAQAAGWPAVTLDEQLWPALGGRTYGLLSESERYRVRVALQVAMARLDGSDAVVLDGAEVLDRAGRNGLAKLLMAAKLPALVAMTTEDRTRNPPPDFGRHGVGRTYWIQGGTVTPWAEMKEAA